MELDPQKISTMTSALVLLPVSSLVYESMRAGSLKRKASDKREGCGEVGNGIFWDHPAQQPTSLLISLPPKVFVKHGTHLG